MIALTVAQPCLSAPHPWASSLAGLQSSEPPGALEPAHLNKEYLRNHARMPHCLRWGGMASLLGGLGDRFPQHNRELPSKSPAACGGDLYYKKNSKYFFKLSLVFQY